MFSTHVSGAGSFSAQVSSVFHVKRCHVSRLVAKTFDLRVSRETGARHILVSSLSRSFLPRVPLATRMAPSRPFCGAKRIRVCAEQAPVCAASKTLLRRSKYRVCYSGPALARQIQADDPVWASLAPRRVPVLPLAAHDACWVTQYLSSKAIEVHMEHLFSSCLRGVRGLNSARIRILPLFAAQAQRAGMFHVKRFSHYELFLIAVLDCRRIARVAQVVPRLRQSRNCGRWFGED